MDLTIERVRPEDARWPAVLSTVKESGQGDWFQFQASWHVGNHVFVAAVDQRIVGFLRFVTQPIGLEDDHEPILLHNKVLTEAKVLAFWVRESDRRQGIGSALQKQAFDAACRLGCYQMRSFSDGEHLENHALKMSLGYAIQPVVRGSDCRALYFLLPCHRPASKQE